MGATIVGMNNLFAGGSVYVQEEFVPSEVVRVLDEEGVNRTMLVPAMIQALLVGVPDIADAGVPRPRADRLRRGARSRWRRCGARIDVFGCEFFQGFGQTEASGSITFLLEADHHRALAGEEHLLLSAGTPIMGTDLRIVDADGNDCAPGEVGEIVARGPQLMLGYWNLPDETAAVLRDGWLHTGDAGTLDDEGFLYVKDRLRDMIVSGAENVYPAEVEQVLFEHEAVADAAVIGVPDEQWGEAVKACVVVRAGAELDEAGLIAVLPGAHRRVQGAEVGRLHGRAAPQRQHEGAQARAAGALLAGPRPRRRLTVRSAERSIWSRPGRPANLSGPPRGGAVW